jgi:hypothetical protein
VRGRAPGLKGPDPDGPDPGVVGVEEGLNGVAVPADRILRFIFAVCPTTLFLIVYETVVFDLFGVAPAVGVPTAEVPGVPVEDLLEAIVTFGICPYALSPDTAGSLDFRPSVGVSFFSALYTIPRLELCDLDSTES